ncbi:S-layer homology domain-containing protein [Paenibacillus dendrobii]|nr:S-layer homology domain-containing protein [Paenibacillus dendrobii]
MQKWRAILLATILLSSAIGARNAYANPIQYPAAQFVGHVFSDQKLIAQDKEQSILEAVNLGLMNGYPSGEFKPTALLTRAELAELLVKAMKLVPSEQQFSYMDVQKGSRSSKYIEAVRQSGLMSGNSNTFRPEDPVTREELAAILVRAVQGQGTSGGLSVDYSDKQSVSQWAIHSVESAIRLGLMDAPERDFLPKQKLQRQDIARYLVDIFPQREHTAVISKIEEDVITIDETPFLVTGELQKFLLHVENRNALQGAILKFKSAARNVQELSEIEIIQSGTKAKPIYLDTSGISSGCLIKISGNHLVLSGQALSQVNIQGNAGDVLMNTDIQRMAINTQNPLLLSGSGTVESMIVQKGAKITLGSDIKVKHLVLPKGTALSDVIQNLAQVQKQIQIVTLEDGTPIPMATTPKSSEPSSGSAAGNPTDPVSPGTDEPTPPLPSVNHAPTEANPVGNQNISVTSGTQTISIANVFTDADGDVLTYEAKSSDTNIVSAVVEGTDLKLTPTAAGTATITVKANDGQGGIAETTFQTTITVPAPINHAPTEANPVGNQNISVTSGTQTVSIANVFTDADGDALTYEAESSDTNIVSAAVEGTDLKLMPIAAGTATITVKANDGQGGIAETTFMVEVKEYSIFFSELFWGQGDYELLQAIEIYNPTNLDLDANKIKITLTNGSEDIQINDENLKILAGKTFTIGEAFYEGEEITPDYKTVMSFFADDSAPVYLTLEYDGQVVDKAFFIPGKSIERISGLLHGSEYQPNQWIDKDTNDLSGLGYYNAD